MCKDSKFCLIKIAAIKDRVDLIVISRIKREKTESEGHYRACIIREYLAKLDILLKKKMKL